MERVNRILGNQVFLEHLRENEAAEEGRIFCHHNMEHFLDVARIAMIFNLQEGLGIPRDMIYGAALLHDIGRHEQYETGTPHEAREIAEAIALHRDSGARQRTDLAGILYRADKASRACFCCKAEGQCNWSRERKNLELQW